MVHDPDQQKQQINERMALWSQGDYVLTSDIPFLRLTIDEDHDLTIAEDEVLGFTLSSQTCDVVRDCSFRPTVELVPLVERPAQEVQDAKLYRRPKYLFVPALEAQNLVGDLDRSVIVDKQVLLSHQPTKGCANTDEQSRMARALARKYDRFAFPDAFNTFVEPITKRFKDKHQRESPEGKHLRAISEIRVAAEPNWDAEQLTILFYLVLQERTEDEDWATWTENWKNKLTLTAWIVDVQFQVLTYKDMTAFDYVNSQLLDFENLSLPRQ